MLAVCQRTPLTIRTSSGLRPAAVRQRRLDFLAAPTLWGRFAWFRDATQRGSAAARRRAAATRQEA